MTETAPAYEANDTVTQMLCLRNDELQAEKDALAAQLDQAEEKLAMLRGQADALHRIGSALDLDPGADLTREAPAKVEVLVAHVKGLKPAVEAFANGLGYCCCGEPMESHSFGCGHSPVDQGWYALDQYMGEAFDNSLALHDANLLGDLAMRWDREGDAQLESGCSGIEHQGRGRKYAACLAANESNRIRKEAQGGEL